MLKHLVPRYFTGSAQQVTKEQRKEKVAPVPFNFYSNKRSETCWSSWWLALAELFPKKGFPSLLRDLLWRRRCILCHFVSFCAFCGILWQHWSIWVEEGGIRLGWAGWSARVPFLVIVSTEHSSSKNFLITLTFSYVGRYYRGQILRVWWVCYAI